MIKVIVINTNGQESQRGEFETEQEAQNYINHIKAMGGRDIHMKGEEKCESI